MGQNASSSEKGKDTTNVKKSRPPIGNSRRTSSLELPDINRPSASRRLQPTAATATVAPITAVTPVVETPVTTSSVPIPIPAQSSASAPPFPSPMPAPPHETPEARQRAPSARHEHGNPTPDAHIHSSIPLGIILQADGGASAAIDEPGGTLVPTTIWWRGGGGKLVQVSGTFESSWSRRITMIQDPNDQQTYSATVRLRPGTHRIKFIIDDVWKCSDELPTATDNDGHLVNYIEVAPASPTAWDPSSETSAPESSRHQTPFGDIIPPHLLHSALLEEQYLSQQMANPPPIPHPAALPRHLERVILNTHRHTRERAVMDGHRDDNSVLPIPNHVVLNHLGTSAIKNGVLAVATTMRYHQKYISTLYFKPVSS